MKNRARWNKLARCAAALVVFGIPVVAQAKYFTRYSSVRNPSCPCAASPFFASFLNSQRQLLACTNDTPADNFVRLVATNIDLVVLFAFPPQLYCGLQPEGGYTSWIAVTPDQFDGCKRLILKAAAKQGIPCLPEIETPPPW